MVGIVIVRGGGPAGKKSSRDCADADRTGHEYGDGSARHDEACHNSRSARVCTAISTRFRTRISALAVTAPAA